MDNKHPEYGGNYDATLYGLKDFISGKLRRSLIVLWCAVGMILLIACVNLSNLLLARAAARAKEFAMRTALGAGRARIGRQLLTESLVLSLSGAVLGLVMAWAIVAWLAHQGSIALLSLAITALLFNTVPTDPVTFGAMVLILGLVALLAGYIPARWASRINPIQALRSN